MPTMLNHYEIDQQEKKVSMCVADDRQRLGSSVAGPSPDVEHQS